MILRKKHNAHGRERAHIVAQRRVCVNICRRRTRACRSSACLRLFTIFFFLHGWFWNNDSAPVKFSFSSSKTNTVCSSKNHIWILIGPGEITLSGNRNFHSKYVNISIYETYFRLQKAVVVYVKNFLRISS